MSVHRKIVCFIRHKADNNRYNNYYCHIFDKVSEYCLHIFIFTLCPAIVIYISARIRIYYITFYALCQSFCIAPKEKPPKRAALVHYWQFYQQLLYISFSQISSMAPCVISSLLSEPVMTKPSFSYIALATSSLLNVWKKIWL